MRILTVAILSLLLVLAFGGAALASPNAGVEAGGLSVFGEYASDAYMYDTTSNAPVIGVGYGLSDSLTIGGEVQYHDADWILWGVYANLALGNFAINLDLLYTESYWYTKLVGLYRIDLDAVKIGAGLGVFWYDELFGEPYPFAEVNADLALGESFALYGAYDYIFDDGDTTFKAGLSFVF